MMFFCKSEFTLRDRIGYIVVQDFYNAILREDETISLSSYMNNNYIREDNYNTDPKIRYGGLDKPEQVSS
jgi:hypothetical protein